MRGAVASDISCCPSGTRSGLSVGFDTDGAYASARDAVWDFVASLRLPYYFRLGLFGFLGTMAWLVIPVTLLALGSRRPFFNLPGILLLGLVAVPLPYLQARFAAENRFRAMFELRSVRDRFKRAPWAFTFALMLLLVGALPLYLLKIEMIPRDDRATELRLPRFHVSRASSRDGPTAALLPRLTPPLAHPLDGPLRDRAGCAVLFVDRFLFPVYRLARSFQPLRATRLPAARAVFGVLIEDHYDRGSRSPKRAGFG